MQNKTILYISPTSLHGGAEEVLLGFMRAVQENGNFPVLVVPDLGWLTENCGKLHIPVEVVKSLPKPYAYNKWVHLRSWLWNAVQIRNIIRRRKVDLVHSNATRAAFHGGLGARLAGVPSVAHVHDVIKLPYQSRLMAAILSALVDQTVCVSRFVENEVIKHAPALKGRTQVIYNGVDQPFARSTAPSNIRQSLGLSQDELVFGVISAMIRMKGQDVLIRAFENFSRCFPKSSLVIVGGAQGIPEQETYEQELRAMAADKGLAGKVHFVGWQENVIDYLQAFDIFTFTPNQPDSLPTVLIHASSMGRPIISTRTGGIPEIVVENESGFLVEPSNTAQLVQCMARLAGDPQLRRKMGNKARQQYEQHFTYETMKCHLLDFYASIVPAA